mmetsp:Transcript_71001/g.199176  ORF Transcript_71001/g.199176 Transcript_71001/m.199176 type:complete len:265 (+) Transcript_71001:661-1455(+)
MFDSVMSPCAMPRDSITVRLCNISTISGRATSNGTTGSPSNTPFCSESSEATVRMPGDFVSTKVSLGYARTSKILGAIPELLSISERRRWRFVVSSPDRHAPNFTSTFEAQRASPIILGLASFAPGMKWTLPGSSSQAQSGGKAMSLQASPSDSSTPKTFAGNSVNRGPASSTEPWGSGSSKGVPREAACRSVAASQVPPPPAHKAPALLAAACGGASAELADAARRGAKACHGGRPWTTSSNACGAAASNRWQTAVPTNKGAT